METARTIFGCGPFLVWEAGIVAYKTGFKYKSAFLKINIVNLWANVI